MKSKISPLIATVTLTVLVLLNSGMVSARACDGCTNRTEIKIPEQAADVLKILHEHDDVLAATVKNKKLSPVSHIVTTMSAYARALPGKAAADWKVAATNAMTSFRTASKGLLRRRFSRINPSPPRKQSSCTQPWLCLMAASITNQTLSDLRRAEPRRDL